MINLARYVAIVLAIALSCGLTFNVHASGYLMIVGGGDTPVEARHLALKSTAGMHAKVVILPYARDTPSRGVKSVELWQKAGARNVINTGDMKPSQVAEHVRSADIIWLPGGSQRLLMEGLTERGLVDLLKSRFTNGAVIGGSSAGAAVMSLLMITRSQETPMLASRTTPLGRGLGFLRGAVVDQHFVERKRYSRLLSVILDHPELIGIGISEDTCVFVFPDGTARVIGPGNVTLFDARRAEINPPETGQPFSATGIRVHVLHDGNQFQITPKSKSNETSNTSDEAGRATSNGGRTSNRAYDER